MLAPEENIFDILFNYYIKENHLLSRKAEIAKQAFLLVVSLSGTYNYSLPAICYAEADDSLLLSHNPIHSVIGTCVPAAAVLYNATNIFFDYYFRERIPEIFQEYLALPETKQRRFFNNLAVLIGSFLSAMPLTTTYLTYEEAALSVAITLSLIIQFDNTVLHFLPIKLMMTQPLYRLPVLPFECFYKSLHTRQLSTRDRRQHLQAQQKYNVFAGFISMINKRLIYGCDVIMQESIRFNPRRLSSRVEIHGLIKNPDLDQILALAPRQIQSKSTLRKVLDNVSFTLGAGWVVKESGKMVAMKTWIQLPFLE